MLKVEKTALAAALGAVRGCVNTRNTIPILANILFERVDGKLLLTGTDLSQQVSAACIAEFEPGFTPFTAPCDDLLRAVKAMPNGPLRFEPDGRGDAIAFVQIKAGRARLKIPTLPASDYEKLKEDGLDHAVSLDADALKRCLAGTRFAVSTEAARPYLQGVYLHPAEAGLMVVATDGYKLSHRLLGDLDDPVGDMPAVTVPTDAVAIVTGLLGDHDIVEVKVSDRKILFRMGDVAVVSKLLETVYPDYLRIVPAKTEITATVAVRDLSDSFARVLAVKNTGPSGAMIIVTIGDGLINLKSRPSETGEAEDTIGAKTQGNVVIGWNGNYVSAMLDAFDGDTVEIAIADNQTPAIFRRPGDADNRMLITPMRI